MAIYQRDDAQYSEVPWEISGYASRDGVLTFKVGRGKLDDRVPQYFKTKTHR